MTGPNGSLEGEADSRQILISQDIWNRTQRRKYGGWGYAHILDNTLPVMPAKGMSEDEIRILMVENPAPCSFSVSWASKTDPAKRRSASSRERSRAGGKNSPSRPCEVDQASPLTPGWGRLRTKE